MKKSSYTLIIATIAIMLILVVSATYAYFTTSISITNNLAFNIEVPNARATFTSYSTNPLSLSVGLANVLIVSSSASVTDTGNLIIKLSAPSGTQVHCKYDIKYVWDSTNQYSTPTMTLNTEHPFEMSLTATATATGDTFSSYSYSSKNLVEKDLSQFSWSGSAGSAGRNSTIIADADVYANNTTGTTVVWTFNYNFYTLPSNQSTFAGKQLLAHIETSNIRC